MKIQKKVLVVVGTRPEAIKMAPVIHYLRKLPGIQSLVCATAQHRHMLDQALGIFGIHPNFDLDIMRPNQTLNQLVSRIVEKGDEILGATQPDLVLVHGDTTTAFAMGLACFHRNIPVGHVEAGLRTYDLARPFPEEMNRRVIDLVATYCFAPTSLSRANLLQELIPAEKIFVTGNTVVDALHFILDQMQNDPVAQVRLSQSYPFIETQKPIVLVTGHRRESFGEGFENICNAIYSLSKLHDFNFVYPVHLNPNVSEPVHRILGGLPNVILLPPLDYTDFVALLSRSLCVITDSGGVQEEAVSLGKPVLVLREVTERPEGVQAGLAQLVGTNVDQIVKSFTRAIESNKVSAESINVYGDGDAAARICQIVLGYQPEDFHKSTATKSWP